MKQKVFYIHGFRPKGKASESTTFSKIESRYPDAVELDYDYEYPEESVVYIIEGIKSHDCFPVIIATSLGSWFAERVAASLVCDIVHYNPSLKPSTSLAKYGLDSDVLNKYTDIETLSTGIRRTIFVAIDDVVVDPEHAINLSIGKANIMFVNGGHRIAHERNFKLIFAATNQFLSTI